MDTAMAFYSSVLLDCHVLKDSKCESSQFVTTMFKDLDELTKEADEAFKVRDTSELLFAKFEDVDWS